LEENVKIEEENKIIKIDDEKCVSNELNLINLKNICKNTINNNI
jgi:hypothetical protein